VNCSSVIFFIDIYDNKRRRGFEPITSGHEIYMIELVITVSYNFFHVIGNNISRETIYSITPADINKIDQFQN
jgi:hypothetical protein